MKTNKNRASGSISSVVAISKPELKNIDFKFLKKSLLGEIFHKYSLEALGRSSPETTLTGV